MSSNDNTLEVTVIFLPKLGDIKEGDFVVIKFEKKKNVKHFVWKIRFRYDYGGCKMSYIRKKPSVILVFPDIIDEASIPLFRYYI